MPSGKREAKVATLPLVGDPTQRNFNAAASLTSGLDQRFRGCQFVVVPDPQKQTKNVYVEKRPGMEALSTIASGRTGHAISPNFPVGDFATTNTFLVALGTGTPSRDTIYEALGAVTTSNCGDLDPATIARGMTVGWFSDVPVVMITAATTPPTGVKTGWYVDSGAFDALVTFTGDTHTNTTIDNISSMTGLYVGQALSGTGITAGTRIATINVSGSSITTDTATTATNAGVTITRTHLAKIIDSDFPSGIDGPVGYMEELNGRAFAMTWGTGRIYQSAQNNVASWAASEFISPRKYKGYGVSLKKYGEFIIGFTSSGVSFFEYSNNPSGSSLNERPGMAFSYGVNSSYGTTAGYPIQLTSSGNNIFWTTPDFNIGIWTIRDGAPTKISGVIEDRILAGSSGSGAWINAFDQNGQHYLFAYTGANQLLYHVESGMWSDPVFGFVPYFGDNVTAGGVISGGTSGKIYTFSDQTPVYTDDGSAFTMTIQTDTWDGGTQDWKQIERIELIGDTQSSGTTTLQISSDDYANFTTIGSFDMTQPRKELFSGGWYQGSVAFKLTNSANTPFRAQALRITYKTGLA